jgi:hypothetical protein
MVNYPTPVVGIRGNRYFMEFLVDQRKTDLFEILVSVLDLLEKNKEGGKILIKNVNSWKGEGVVTMMIEFEECEDLKSSEKLFFKEEILLYCREIFKGLYHYLRRNE